MACASTADVAGAQPTVASNDRGDLALAPYYTVRDDWVTGLHIVNTSPHTQVVKVRFRRATDAMDALDFNLVMSPQDVYAGFLSRTANGAIAWASPDTTCTVPAASDNRLEIPEVYRAGAETGYVEIIAMGRPADERQPIALAARHQVPSTAASTVSTPLDCDAVRSNFFADGQSPTRPGVKDNDETWQRANAESANAILKAGGLNTYVHSGNALKVSYFIRDNATGIEFGDNAVHISNFLTQPALTNQQYSVLSGDLNGFDFPDLNGGVPLSSAGGNSIRRARFDALRAPNVLGASAIVNEWSANPANGVAMDWVLTLPGQYTMLRLPQYVASLAGAGRPGSPTVGSAGKPVANAQCPRVSTPAPATGTAPTPCDYRDMPVEVDFTAYNREAFKTGDDSAPELAISPAPPGTVKKTYLPKVANVITFGGNRVLGQSDATISADLGQPYGWVRARVKSVDRDVRVCDWDLQDDIGAGFGTTAGEALNNKLVCSSVSGGVPVIGFAAWSRRVAANPEASYGRIVGHSYERAGASGGGQGPAPSAPAAPARPDITTGNARATLFWQAVAGADTYNLYYAQESFAGLGNPPSDYATLRGGAVAADIAGTTHTLTALANGSTYYFVVTAKNAGGESPVSEEVSCTPATASRTGFRDTLKDGGQGPEMVMVPTGCFRMGSPDTETGRDSDEGPVRTVTISKRIAIGKYEVTFADYDRFADATTGVDRPGDQGWGRGTRPVINVSQTDAKAYADWLSAQTGKSYRLPTEAEWEYAARAGTTTRYSWGDSITCSQASYGRWGGGSCNTSRDTNLARTMGVGSFAANPFGLYDTHGNVYEFVEDCWHNNYEGAPSDGSAWTTGCVGTRAVVRGGSWYFFPLWVRSADRFRFWPSNRFLNVGFRLVQDINP